MILGRRTNLWLGAFTAVFNVIVVAAHTVPGLEGLQGLFNEVLVSVINIAVAAVIALVANQTPSVIEGDQVNVVTASGTPNKRVTV